MIFTRVQRLFGGKFQRFSKGDCHIVPISESVIKGLALLRIVYLLPRLSAINVPLIISGSPPSTLPEEVQILSSLIFLFEVTSVSDCITYSALR